MTTILLFVALLALLILAHEAGHFFVARWHGVAAHEFGFGFPPRLVGWARREDGTWERVGRVQRREYPGTIYSINWLPLGGFVRIKGEDGVDKSADSFGSRSAWVRFQILVAGVVMNLLVAWVLFSVALMAGMPQAVDPDEGGADVRIERVMPSSTAAMMGIRTGDVVTRLCSSDACTVVTRVADVQTFAREQSGRDATVTVRRGETVMTLSGTLTPRDGQVLGVGLTATRMVYYTPPRAIAEGARETVTFVRDIVVGLGNVVAQAVRGRAAADVAGPVGIAVMTGQVAELGIAFLAQFAAVLSVNLAVINILPIPALDGGRILFLLIEKARRGRPVDRNVEGIIHGVSFALLIGLMLVITVRDVMHFF